MTSIVDGFALNHTLHFLSNMHLYLPYLKQSVQKLMGGLEKKLL